MAGNERTRRWWWLVGLALALGTTAAAAPGRAAASGGPTLAGARAAGSLLSAARSAQDCPAGSVINVVAHEDDDLLFLSPDLQHDIDAGRCVTTVYLTAGDARQTLDGANTAPAEAYWKGRETGELAAYAAMAGVAWGWTETDAGVPGHDLQAVDNLDAPRLRLVFLRLKDGLDGVLPEQTLRKAWFGQSSLTVLHDSEHPDRAEDYSREDLISILGSLYTQAPGPVTIRTLDSQDDAVDRGDHSDHHFAALFAHSAHDQFAADLPILDYQGYPQDLFVANVTGTDLDRKTQVFYAYAQHDPNVCPGDCPATLEQFPGPFDYPSYLHRQYRIEESSTRRVQIRGLAGACLDVRGEQRSQDAAVQVYWCVWPGNRTQLNQRWWLDGGQIVGFDEKCLTIPGGDTSNGTDLVMGDCVGLPWQQWTVQPNGGVVGYGGKCLDAEGGSYRNGTNAQIWDCVDVPQQRWGIGEPPADGSGYQWADRQIVGLGGDACVDIVGGSNGDGAPVHVPIGTPVQIWQCGGGAGRVDVGNQRWTLTSTGELIGQDGMCLDIRGGTDAAGNPVDVPNGTRVQVWSCVGGLANQHWTLTPGGDLVSAFGKCLDIPAADTTPGTPLQVWDCADVANQKWQLR
jgi:Ricin-type beta-trefoil lectin domain/GlcNAc-PI de-N-acetylase